MEKEKDGIRLNKYLSAAGVCSRREADVLIAAGKVKIDGQTATMGTRVLPGQAVSCDGKPVGAKEEPVLLVVNKPRGIVCTTSTKDRAENIIEFLHYPTRIYPVGRLDKDSEGLLLMTNQGELMDQILRARNGHEKEYQVVVDKKITPGFVKKMSEGVEILDTVTRPCKVVKTGDYEFTIVLTQGLNRQIRRMCEALGYTVTRLKRVRIMNLPLGSLATGKWREVTREEYKELKRMLRRGGQDVRG